MPVKTRFEGSILRLTATGAYTWPDLHGAVRKAMKQSGFVAGRSLLRLGMHAIGGERDQEVVASAGARGVATVRTPAGEITVMPDTAAILRMQRGAIGIVTLDRFLREGGIRAPAQPAAGGSGGTDGSAKEEEGV